MSSQPTDEPNPQPAPPADTSAARWLHIVLHQPEIPYNTGSVGRTCVALGAKLWLVRPLGFRLDDYYLRRAGLDYWEHLDFAVVDDWQALSRELPLEQAWYFTKHATHSYLNVEYTPGNVLVFGCESQGLPAPLLAEHPGRSLRIPIAPEARSLNLSNAVAVAAFEAQRQVASRAAVSNFTNSNG
jgi:tRNA (cytidine/uridine-2'-O-)-methyltransferase